MFNTEQPSFIRLRDIVAERINPVVFWVGSGLSAQADLPLWNGLVKQLVNACNAKIETQEEADKVHYKKKIEAAARSTPWITVQQLKAVLGEASFQAEIRSALSPSRTASAPDIYKTLWRLRPSGLLNLNLDRLATRAYAEESRIESTEFVGNRVGSYMHVLRNLTHPFIANLHGILDDAESWVLTWDDLKALLNSRPYNTFIDAVFVSRTVVFVGMSADDVAAGGFLENLKARGISPHGHYWVTSRLDDETNRWAEEFGIEVIRYTAINNDHSELNDCFTSILSHLPHEEAEAPPISPSIEVVAPVLNIPPPTQLAAESPETIREILNSHAAILLKEPTPDAINKYEEFCRVYSRPIHNAWYVSLKSPDNIILGHELLEDVGRGAFGRVFKARHIQTGEIRALKILWEEARDTKEMLSGFRRGVRSMEILSARNVSGMVAYRDTYEIPAIAIMDFVEGPNLADAVHSGFLESWEDRIRGALSLAVIIRSAHTLPERVLHRDIRPANVMLRDYYTEPEKMDVVVLDFDLSWHMGEKSVSFVPTKHGYLAPEQIGLLQNTSTRSAAVDSFGFGMTLFFICSRRDPGLNEHTAADWSARVFEACRVPVYKKWLSLNNRVARLILSATKHRQAERLDMGQIQAELGRLQSVIENPKKVWAADLWAEEIAAHVNLNTEYIWEEDSRTAIFQLQSGVRISLRADETERKIKLIIEWLDVGTALRRNVDRYLPKVTSQAAGLLRTGRFNVQKNVSKRNALLEAHLDVGEARTSVREIAQAIEQATRQYVFN